jgi:hypothetical protein
MSLEYIRKTYDVPAKRGTRVKFTPDSRDKPEFGKIVGAKAGVLRVRMDGSKRTTFCHPTWQIEYLATASRRISATEGK